MTGPAEDQKQKIQAQLDRILSGVTFSGSERHRRFLSFVVEQALKGDTDKLNEFVLGFEVFNKGDSFDPRIDSIVRVEASRLRARLKKYYQEEGRNDPLIITLRPRSFVPEFEDAAEAPPARTGLWARLVAHKTIVIAAGALLCGVALTAAVLLFLRSTKPALPQASAILVLPFQMLGPKSDQDLLGDAIADAIITGLAGTPGLRVISRGAGIQFQESGRSAEKPVADLNVDYVVQGTVQVTNGRARVTAKMTDTRSQSYVWAQTREIRLEAMADLEREWTGSIVARIQAPPPPSAGQRVVRRRARGWEAYGAFLKGQYYWYQQDSDSLEKSIALFEQATQGDPSYAPAWAWLSQGYLLKVLRNDGRDAVLARGRQAAAKALALDDHLAESYSAVGSYAALDWNWSDAERYFRRAVELNPDWAQGHLMYSLMYLLPTGQMRAAVGEMLRAHELDPLTRITRSVLAEVLYFNRDYSRAIAEAEDLRTPSAAASPLDRAYFLSLSLSGQGRRALAELSPVVPATAEPSPALSLLGYLLAKHGDRRQAQAILQRLLQKSATSDASPLSIALVSVGLGNSDEALRQLQVALKRRLPSACQVAVDPVFDPLRADPRYSEIVRAIGLKAAL